MPRTLNRGPFITKEFYKNLKKNTKSKILKIFNKSLTITPELIGKKVEVYNGNKFIYIYIEYKKLGKKIGKFIFTKKLRSKKIKN